jgi:vancomycin resistance protein VanW
MIGRWLLIAAYAAAATALIGAAGFRPREREQVLSRFVTSLRDRTPNQSHNVALATRTISGRWLAPGETFSFNRSVGSWSSDTGYRHAPVSYDGELVPSWGGGVCQASTTLYNAALLAGLTVVERHRHRWVPRYVPPGRDAAVAYSNIDLKIRNDHPWPVRLEGEVRGDLVEFRIVGRGNPESRWEIRQKVDAVREPQVILQGAAPGGSGRVRNPGRAGARVRTTRVELRGGAEVRRELLTDDSYPAMNRLLLGE